MRTVVLGALKLLAVGLVVAGAFDVKIPRGFRPRMRIYLLDDSASVRVRGAAKSVTIDDAWRLLAADARRFDRVLVVAIGRIPSIRFEGSPSVLPSALPESEPTESSDIAAALAHALARAPENFDVDALLLSDGLPTEGDLPRALLACTARGLAVHTVAVGPRAARDVRILRIEAPSFVSTGETFDIEVDVESGVEAEVAVSLAGGPKKLEERITLVADVPRHVRFRAEAPSDFVIEARPIGFDDACPANNTTRWSVRLRSDRLRILVLSPGSAATPLLRAQAPFVVTESPAFRDPFEFDAVVIDGLPARAMTEDHQRRLRDFVTGFGGGLLALGGPQSFGPGGYAGTPVEEILPVWAFPNESLAIVFVLDASGSMAAELPDLRRRKIDVAKRSVEDVLGELRADDPATVVAFPSERPALAPLSADRSDLVGALRRLDAGGPTAMLPAMREAVKLLEAAIAPRKHILLLSDGVTEEPPDLFEKFKNEIDHKRIGLSFVLTGDRAGEAARRLATPIPVTDWQALSSLISERIRESRSAIASPKGFLRPVGRHPATEGIERWAQPRRINRVSLKPGAELAVDCEAHAILAFRTAGRGRTGAAAFALHRDWSGTLDAWRDLSRLLSQSVTWTSPGAASPYVLSSAWTEDGIVLSAVGPEEGPDELIVEFERGDARLRRVSRTGWEGRLPLPPPGTTYFRVRGQRGATSAFHVPYSAEYRRLGPDDSALREIARATGGRVVSRPADLEAGPARRREWRSGRTLFLIAAALLFLLDLGLSTFWRKS